MIKLQTWKPDTCKCIIEEAFNTETGEITCNQVLYKCDDHEDVSMNEIFGVIYANPDGENKRKNLIHKELVENKSLGLSETKKNSDKSEYEALKDDIKYLWSFTGKGKNRILQIEIKGVIQSLEQEIIMKTHLKDHAKQKFGDGKVEVL